MKKRKFWTIALAIVASLAVIAALGFLGRAWMMRRATYGGYMSKGYMVGEQPHMMMEHEEHEDQEDCHMTCEDGFAPPGQFGHHRSMGRGYGHMSYRGLGHFDSPFLKLLGLALFAAFVAHVVRWHHFHKRGFPGFWHGPHPYATHHTECECSECATGAHNADHDEDGETD